MAQFQAWGQQSGPYGQAPFGQARYGTGGWSSYRPGGWGDAQASAAASQAQYGAPQVDASGRSSMGSPWVSGGIPAAWSRVGGFEPRPWGQSPQPAAPALANAAPQAAFNSPANIPSWLSPDSYNNLRSTFANSPYVAPGDVQAMVNQVTSNPMFRESYEWNQAHPGAGDPNKINTVGPTPLVSSPTMVNPNWDPRVWDPSAGSAAPGVLGNFIQVPLAYTASHAAGWTPQEAVGGPGSGLPARAEGILSRLMMPQLQPQPQKY